MITAVPYFPATKHWAEWAVSGTRFLIPRRIVSNIWVYVAYGTKVALVARLPHVLDFNQSMFRKSAGDSDTVPGLLDIMVEITSYFEEVAMEMPLPYRCQEFDLRDSSLPVQRGVMCCEDNVVVVDV